MSQGIVDVGDVALHYRIDGTSGPWVTFSNSLLTDLTIWDEQAATLSSTYRVLRYDQRGHGASGATPGVYDFEMLATDLRGLLDCLGIEHTHIVGISMGGNTVATFAARNPERVLTVTMADCQPQSTESSGAVWRERAEIARTIGLNPIVDSAMDRWFDPEFLIADRERRQTLWAMMSRTSLAGYLGSVGLLEDYDVRSLVMDLGLRSLLIAGERDRGAMRSLAELVPVLSDAKFVSLHGAGHLSCIDGGAAFSDALVDFLDSETKGVAR